MRSSTSTRRSPFSNLLIPDGDNFRPAAPSASDIVRKSIPIAWRAARMFAATCVFVIPGGLPLTRSVSIERTYSAVLDNASVGFYR